MKTTPAETTPATTPAIFTGLDNYQLTRHRAELAKRYRGWELTKLPGYELNGSQRFAFVAIRRAKIYYRFVLDYDELDWVSEHQEGPPAEFFRALYQIPSTETLLHFHGTGVQRNPGYLPRDDSVHALWQKHQSTLPDHAQLNHGGWRWWRGKGLTLEFCEELKRLAIDRYREAQTALEYVRTSRTGLKSTMKIAVDEGRAFLRTHCLALGCGSLKFNGLDDYLIGFALQFALEPSEVNRLRAHGILPLPGTGTG